MSKPMLTHGLARSPDNATVLIDAGRADFIDREIRDIATRSMRFGAMYCDVKSPSSVCAGQSRPRRRAGVVAVAARRASEGDKAKERRGRRRALSPG
ncbi:hypothetical protein AB4Y32_16750 [Paraburkholderia phymatum]|uniref:Uncharacterized protein n=1 Tax=Paraburkholderia phymatum TaxID=148447 RepID=A0ACC6U1D5_9BURK